MERETALDTYLNTSNAGNKKDLYPHSSAVHKQSALRRNVSP